MKYLYITYTIFYDWWIDFYDEFYMIMINFKKSSENISCFTS